MHPDFMIERQRAHADERGQLARGPSPRQIHLKEPVLRVQEAQRARHVLARGAANRGDAEPVALDLDRCSEPGKLSHAIQLRQACANPAPRQDRAGDTGDQDDEEGDQQCLENPAHDLGHVITTARTG